MANKAQSQFKGLYGGKSDALDAHAAKSQDKMRKLYSGATARINQEIQAARSDIDFATAKRQKVVMAKINSIAKEFYNDAVELLMACLYRADTLALDRCVSDLGVIGVEADPVKLDGVNDDLMAQTDNDVTEYLSAQTVAIVATARRALRKDASLIMRRAAIDGISRRAATDLLQGEILKKGVDFKFTDRGGRNWGVSNYLDMLVNTLIYSVEREGYANILIETGIDLAIISTSGTDSRCKSWEGKTISMTGTTPGYPSFDEALASGEVFRPRCTHRLLPFNETTANILEG